MCLLILLAGINLYDVEDHHDCDLVRMMRAGEAREDENVLASFEQAHQQEAYTSGAAIWFGRRRWCDHLFRRRKQKEEAAAAVHVSCSSLSLTLSLSRSLR